MPDIINENGTWVITEDNNLSKLNMDVVDLTDGSWTFIDPLNQFKSSTFSDNVNTVTLNAISAGNANQNTNNDYQGARWFKFLKYDDGTQVNSTDNFTLILRVQAFSSSSPSAFGLGLGTARNPYETGSTDVSRQTWQHLGLVNTNTSTTSGNPTAFDRLIKFGGGASNGGWTTNDVCEATHKFSAGKSYGIRSTPTKDQQGQLNGTHYSASVPLYMQVGVITRYNTMEALDGAEHKLTLKYQVIRINES